MRILIATDAWYPQINGVVRTLDTVRRELEELGHRVDVIGPDRFPGVPMPSYPEIRVAVAPGRRLARLMDELRPDAVHVPVEGPIGQQFPGFGSRTRDACVRLLATLRPNPGEVEINPGKASPANRHNSLSGDV